MLQKIDLYVATYVPQRAKSVCKACSAIWCTFTMWFAYCYSFWALYSWSYILNSTEFELEDFTLMHLIVMLNQILWGFVADIHPAFNIFLICILTSVLNYYSNEDGNALVFIRDLFIHMNLALIIPASSVLYARVVNYKQLCVMFCFLKCSQTLVKIFAYNENYPLRALYISFMLCMTVTIVLSTIISVFCEKVKRELFPSRNICLKMLWLTRKGFVVKLALCAFLLKLMNKITMENIKSNFNADILYEKLFQTDIVACIVCGLLSTGFNFSSKKHNALKSLYRIHLLICPFFYIATYFIDLLSINPFTAIWVYSLYFTLMEVFLINPLSVKVGEYYGNSEAALTSIIMAVGTLGEAAAFIVLSLLPTIIHPVITMIIMILYTYGIYSINECYEQTLLSL